MGQLEVGPAAWVLCTWLGLPHNTAAGPQGPASREGLVTPCCLLTRPGKSRSNTLSTLCVSLGPRLLAQNQGEGQSFDGAADGAGDMFSGRLRVTIWGPLGAQL